MHDSKLNWTVSAKPDQGLLMVLLVHSLPTGQQDIII